MITLSILGATGSIGTSAVDVVSKAPDRFRVAGLAAAGGRLDVLEGQIRRLLPRVVAVAGEEAAAELRRRVSGIRDLEILSGPEGMETVASLPEVGTVLSAIAGADGLLPTLAAVRAGKRVGLANKESLVVSGRIMMEEARRHGAAILPVDSEHSAVFQCLEGRRREDLRKIILTASGGPFRNLDPRDLAGVSVEDALNHPNWSMGKKITIDSATLMNKGLEVIEARWLFDIDPDRIGVVIHPESIVHSMVEFVDGSILAQMSQPDMKGPIGYALAYPERIPDTVAPLDLTAVGRLTFEKPDLGRFPCLSLAYEALRAGGTMPAVLNAADETAVAAFLSGRISFTGIATVVRKCMDRHQPGPAESIGEVLEAMAWAREMSEGLIDRSSSLH